jgi:hypothetical protein
MTKEYPNFDVDELLTTPTSSWHKRIAVDLISEIEKHLVEIGTIPEMRRFLAVKGYRELHQRIEQELKARTDPMRYERWRMRCATTHWNVLDYLRPPLEIRSLIAGNGTKQAVNWPRQCSAYLRSVDWRATKLSMRFAF